MEAAAILFMVIGLAMVLCAILGIGVLIWMEVDEKKKVQKMTAAEAIVAAKAAWEAIRKYLRWRIPLARKRSAQAAKIILLAATIAATATACARLDPYYIKLGDAFPALEESE